MNNDSPPRPSVPPEDENATADPSEDATEEGTNTDNIQLSKKQLQSAKEAEALDDLIHSLDIIIYCELSILYYMDNTFLQLVIRILPQFFYFTPKSAIFPSPPTNRSYLLVIFFTNLICFLSHALSDAPEAGEAMRGYLHGGAITDFVGVKGPVSKIGLVGMDLLVWLLQIGCLAMVMERRGARRGETRSRGGNGAAGRTIVQDVDAEEQGRRRSAENDGVEEGIELQPLPTSSTHSSANETLEDSPLTMSDHPLDLFATGEHVIANFHLLETIRTSWNYVNISIANPTSAVSTGTRRETASDGRRLRIATNGMNVEVRLRT